MHFEIRMAGIKHLNSFPELYIESISNDLWAAYIQQMSQPGTWCDNVIMYAFSKENDMIPSVVPSQLQGLTKVEEVLIARALPIMRVYIKPGGQRGYSGHCINLPQNVEQLAHSLPRHVKDVSVIVQVKVT